MPYGTFLGGGYIWREPHGWFDCIGIGSGYPFAENLCNFVSPKIKAIKLDEAGGTTASVALQIAAAWSAILHLVLAVAGTFILKRFSTAFTVGGFLGVTTVVSQQNLLLFAAFYHYKHGNLFQNYVFADLALALFMVLTFFSLLLGHFRNHVIVK